MTSVAAPPQQSVHDMWTSYVVYVPWLKDCAKAVHSQFGEDGLIAEVLRHYGTSNRWCFEVGAGDGSTLSNTKVLRDDGWSGLLIEADPACAKQLKACRSDDVRVVQATVGPYCSLDSLLTASGAPRDLDFGVIDIDGRDYFVWREMTEFQPRVMLVEYAPYIYEQKFDPSVDNGQQAQLHHIEELGITKGYTLVARTFCNALFVRSELCNGEVLAEPLELSAPEATNQHQDIKIAAVVSIPRVGWNDHWGCMIDALAPFKIPVRRTIGAYWGQCMQNVLEECVADGLDWVLTLDYDSMFTADHLDSMLGIFGTHPKIDALAALQRRRVLDTPLMTIEGQKGVETDGSPIKVCTAHFGMTLLRVECLKALPKPWFQGQPGPDGCWRHDDALHPDIWFWKQWRDAGFSVYVTPAARIGHLELMVSQFDEHMQPECLSIDDWRKANDKTKERKPS